MEIISVSSDIYYNYPFSEDIFNQSDIIYHATNSNFTESIEISGWNENSQPYDLNDIRYLCDTCYNLFFNNIPEHSIPKELDKLYLYYTTITLLTLRNTNSHSNFKKENCFTDDYWNAISYASNLYGETLVWTFKFIDEFIHILNLPTYIDSFKSICSIEDKNTIIFNLNKIKDKYINLVTNSYPVIYAIKGRNEWFNSVTLNSKIFNGDFFPRNLDLKTTSYISPDSILGKIEFLDGVKRHSISITEYKDLINF